MAVNLARLEQAADRFEKYADKMQHADSPAAREERARVAKRHREQFLPAAEKFQQLRSSAVVPRTIEGAAAPPITDVAVIEGGVIPEILQRDNDLRPVRYLQIALLAARSVGRVRVVDAAGDDEGDGTGFLVAPGLLLTNWHVLKTRELAEACSVIFDDEDGLDGDPKESKAYRFLPQRLYVSDRELDYAIVEVAPRTGSGTPLSQFGYLRLFEQTGKLDPTQRQAANIVQHPGGGPKKVAIRDNYFAQVLPDSVDPDQGGQLAVLWDRHAEGLLGRTGLQRPMVCRRAAPRRRAGDPGCRRPARPRPSRRNAGAGERSSRSRPLHHQRGNPRQPDLCVATRQAGSRAARCGGARAALRCRARPKDGTARPAHRAHCLAGHSCRRRRAPSRRSSIAASPSSKRPRVTGPRF